MMESAGNVDRGVLRAERLVRTFAGRRGRVIRAVNGVDLELRPGETLAVVGESGCGKSTLARLLVRLLDPTEGRVLFEDRDLATLSRRDLRRTRRRLQIVFQDPYASLDPRARVGTIIARPLRVHGLHHGRGERAKRVAHLLDLVGLDPALARRRPRELSGGQRQRVAIARALALEPRAVVLDEPVSALDVSVRAQIVEVLGELQRRLGLAYVFVAHDLSVVRHLADRVAVMYLGRIVEQGPTDSLFRSPAHPYTQALLSAAPALDPNRRRRETRIVLRGEPPDPAAVPGGCALADRCWLTTERCRCEDPEPVVVARGHSCRCHLASSTDRSER